MRTIITFTGHHVDPFHPDPKEITLRDICHALSLLCRGGGHVKTFYSVGQHVLACGDEARAREAGKRVELGCLLHDASEAYMVDLPTPIKDAIPIYRETEDHLLEVIFTKFMGTPPDDAERKQIFDIDHDMTSMDIHMLMKEDINDRYKNIVVCPAYTDLPVEVISRRLFERIYQLSAAVCRA